MLTARAGLDSKIEGLDTGADDYIVKPFEARELTARVRNLIKERQRLRDHYRSSEHRIDPSKVTTTSLDKKFLEKVLALLEARHDDPGFGVAEMQKSLALSKTQLNRKLKALTDESPGQLLRNFRLKRAAQLLSQEADTVTQIAYQVGFTNLSYFAKCFKSAVRCSAFCVLKCPSSTHFWASCGNLWSYCVSAEYRLGIDLNQRNLTPFIDSN